LKVETLGDAFEEYRERCIRPDVSLGVVASHNKTFYAGASVAFSILLEAAVKGKAALLAASDEMQAELKAHTAEVEAEEGD